MLRWHWVMGGRKDILSDVSDTRGGLCSTCIVSLFSLLRANEREGEKSIDSITDLN